MNGSSSLPVPPSFFFRPTVGIEQLGRASKLRTDADVSERVVVGVAAPRRPSASLLLVNRRATAALLLGAKTFFSFFGRFSFTASAIREEAERSRKIAEYPISGGRTQQAEIPTPKNGAPPPPQTMQWLKAENEPTTAQNVALNVGA